MTALALLVVMVSAFQYATLPENNNFRLRAPHQNDNALNMLSDFIYAHLADDVFETLLPYQHDGIDFTAWCNSSAAAIEHTVEIVLKLEEKEHATEHALLYDHFVNELELAETITSRVPKRSEVGGDVSPGVELFDPVSAVSEPNKKCRTEMQKYLAKCQFHGK